MPITRYIPLLLCGCAAVYCQDQPVAFDAASVKVSPQIDRTKRPDFGCKGGPGTSDPGLFTCSYANMQGLVIEAFELAPYQFPYVPSRDHSAYDLTARVPAGSTRKQFLQMVQGLLAERFKLAYHFEKKASPVYELMIAKGGSTLKESAPEPQEHTGGGSPARDEYGFWPVGPDFKGSSILRSGDVARWVGREVTTAHMAKLLAVSLKSPVTNSTGLDGKYDFTLYCSAESVGLSPEPAVEGAAKAVRETDAALSSIFVVLQAKLGLKLERRQGYFDLFVVDHVEKTPTEN